VRIIVGAAAHRGGRWHLVALARVEGARHVVAVGEPVARVCQIATACIQADARAHRASRHRARLHHHAIRTERAVEGEAIGHPADLGGVLASGHPKLLQEAARGHVVMVARRRGGGRMTAALVKRVALEVGRRRGPAGEWVRGPGKGRVDHATIVRDADDGAECGKARLLGRVVAGVDRDRVRARAPDGIVWVETRRRVIRAVAARRKRGPARKLVSEVTYAAWVAEGRQCRGQAKR